ncbi:MAG: hypothetical protein QM734_05995 [Cyclobacteriaceae bacterium]
MLLQHQLAYSGVDIIGEQTFVRVINATDFKSGSVVWVDTDFIPTYKIKFLSGYNFNPNVKSDMKSYDLNEAALLTAYGLGTAQEALNERLILGGDTVAISGGIEELQLEFVEV